MYVQQCLREVDICMYVQQCLREADICMYVQQCLREADICMYVQQCLREADICMYVQQCLREADICMYVQQCLREADICMYVQQQHLWTFRSTRTVGANGATQGMKPLKVLLHNFPPFCSCFIIFSYCITSSLCVEPLDCALLLSDNYHRSVDYSPPLSYTAYLAIGYFTQESI